MLTRISAITICFVLIVLAQLELNAQVRVSLPTLTSNPERTIKIPIMVENIRKQDVTSFEFVVSCDTSVLRLLGVDQKGTLTEGLMMMANNSVAPFGKGRMKVVCASAVPISDDGVLVNISAGVGRNEGKSLLELSKITLNAGKPESKLFNGSITVRSPANGKEKGRQSSGQLRKGK